MIKTNLELLEKNRDDAQSMVLAMTAQISLAESKNSIIVDPSKEQERMKRLKMVEMMKSELRGHIMMVAEFDKMIEQEKKNETVRGSDR